MSPEQAIGSVKDLVGDVSRYVFALAGEADGISDQWEQLGRIGGQRADHAAALLARLRMILDDLSKYTATASTQITRMVADPFGRIPVAA